MLRKSMNFILTAAPSGAAGIFLKTFHVIQRFPSLKTVHNRVILFHFKTLFSSKGLTSRIKS